MTTNPIPPPAPADATKDSEEDSSSATSNAALLEASKSPDKVEIADDGVGAAAVTTDKETAMATAVVAAAGGGADDPMEEDPVGPATVFCIKLKQPRSNLQHKMSVPELCRNFR